MLILAIIIGGMFVGLVVQLLLGRRTGQVDWALALVSGLVGSFIGGLLSSLLAGDGLAIKPSGLIGTFVGALIVTLGWQAYRKQQRTAERDAASAAARSGRHH